jgi:hypothetical protein
MAESDYENGQRLSPSPDFFPLSQSRLPISMGEEMSRSFTDERDLSSTSGHHSLDTERGRTARLTRESEYPGPQDHRHESTIKDSSDPDKSESFADASDASRHRSFLATSILAEARPSHSSTTRRIL